MTRVLFTAILLFLGSCLHAQNPTPPVGYEWSPNIGKPAKLYNAFRFPYARLAAGNYDVATVPVGDNWSLAPMGAFATVKLETPGNFSVMARFQLLEPSCGFVIVSRGPYADGTPVESRPAWKMTTIYGGLVFRRISMPIWAHSGARYDRYATNGYEWRGDGLFPAYDEEAYWRPSPPTGMKLLDGTQAVITPSMTPPDVTILSSMPAAKVYLAYSIVDMMGRETPISDVLEVPASIYGINSSIIAYRPTDAPHGSCGFYVYAGTSPDNLHRQPVLDYEGREPRYLWPLWLQQFVFNKLTLTEKHPDPSPVVSSLLNWPQQQEVAGAKVIVADKPEYYLYCPFILRYSLGGVNFGRSTVGKTEFKHRTLFQSGGVEYALKNEEIPLCLCQNQNDKITDWSFFSLHAIAGLTFADYSGGQAIGNTFERCLFDPRGADSYGLLVDNRCSSPNSHTCSELLLKHCGFGGTIPVKLEGTQTAKVRFIEFCEFAALGSTRYRADTSGIVYQCCPNGVSFHMVKGINTGYHTFRSLATFAPQQGEGRLILDDVTVDQSTLVGVTFGSYHGGQVVFQNGERINGTPRLVEAPVVFDASLRMSNFTLPMAHRTSCFSAMLNQLTLDLDFQINEIIAPDELKWTQRLLPLVYSIPSDPGYFDFRKKRSLRYTFGFEHSTDAVIKP